MASLSMILGAATFIKQVLLVGMEMYNLVKAYGSNFPPKMPRSDALRTVKGIIAKLRQDSELPILQAKNKLKDCPDISRIPDDPKHPLYDAKQQVLNGMRAVRGMRAVWWEALERLWEEYEAHFQVLTDYEIDLFNAALHRAEGLKDPQWSQAPLEYSEAPKSITRTIGNRARADERSHRRDDRVFRVPSVMRTEAKRYTGTKVLKSSTSTTPGEFPAEQSLTFVEGSTTEGSYLTAPTTLYTTRVVSRRKEKLAHSQTSIPTSENVESLVTATRKLTVTSRPVPKDITRATSRRVQSSTSNQYKSRLHMIG